MKKSFYASIEEAANLLQKSVTKFVAVIEDGDMAVEYYAPKNIDKQKPHSRDEIYIIASGSSDFLRDKEIIRCKTGDVIFVPALMGHRFINFTNGFATWVIFYGKEKT